MIAVSEKESITLSKAQYSIYACICYFNIFQYPLLESEIFEFADQRLTLFDIRAELVELKAKGLIFENQSYWSAQADMFKLIEKRQGSERYFRNKLRTIKRYGRFISKFPFVRFVGISGSCSKGLLDETGDVDYFIITTPGRLWLCRTILILFKKVFLLNSKKYFCVNYFIDSDTLEIPDRNLFVAHELRTLAPVNNQQLYQQFLLANLWTNDMLPNKKNSSLLFYKDEKTVGMFGRLIELILSNRIGGGLESLCFKLTFKTWKKRFTNLSAKEFELNFRSRKNISKHHPRGFQKKVTEALQHQLRHVRVAQ